MKILKKSRGIADFCKAIWTQLLSESISALQTKLFSFFLLVFSILILGINQDPGSIGQKIRKNVFAKESFWFISPPQAPTFIMSCNAIYELKKENINLNANT